MVQAQEDRSVLWKIIASLSEIEQASGHVELADRLRGQARAVVDDIAAHAGEMRDVFQGQSAVIRLLGE